MKRKPPNTAFVYVRVSTAEQYRDAYGIESQLSACLELCRERGWTVREIFRDCGISAWKDVERPGFIRMMQQVRKTPDINVVFYDYSRFGRKVRPALDAFDKLDSLGVFSVAANNPGIDCRTANGRNLPAG